MNISTSLDDAYSTGIASNNENGAINKNDIGWVDINYAELGSVSINSSKNIKFYLRNKNLSSFMFNSSGQIEQTFYVWWSVRSQIDNELDSAILEKDSEN